MEHLQTRLPVGADRADSSPSLHRPPCAQPGERQTGRHYMKADMMLHAFILGSLGSLGFRSQGLGVQKGLLQCAMPIPQRPSHGL